MQLCMQLNSVENFDGENIKNDLMNRFKIKCVLAYEIYIIM